MQCYIYLLYISYFTNKCETGGLDIIEHSQIYLGKHYINIKKTFEPFIFLAYPLIAWTKMNWVGD